MRNPRNDRLGSDNPSGDPVRRCVLTGEHDAREALIRLAISPEGEVLPDVLARAPGRGAWLAVDRAALDKALASGKLRGALARAFKGAQLTIPADLGERIEAALARALTERLGLELRAGKLLLGSERIEQAARNGLVAWLGHARDAGEDGNRRLDQAWRVGRDAEGSGLGGTVLPLDRATLSVALGRDNVVHLALTDSAAARRLAALLGRLTRFLGDHPSGDPHGSGVRSAAEAIHDAAPAVPRDDKI
jgi:predicted RNA-binding protein YlxR (DUF448 family)